MELSGSNLAACIAACFLLAGCVAEVGRTEEDVASQQAELINGDLVEPRFSGFVRIASSDGGKCTGVLLRNDWVLTAKHCFTTADQDNPAGVVIEMGRGGAYDPYNIGFFKEAAEIILHPNRDIALVRTDGPFRMPNNMNGLLTFSDFERGIYSGPLSGATVECYGYGVYTVSQALDGRLRSGTFGVIGATSNSFAVDRNSRGQVPYRGDSGGPCMLDTGTDVLVAGIVVQGFYRGGSFDDPDEVTHALAENVASLREWVSNVLSRRTLVRDGRCLDIPSGLAASGLQAQLFACNGGDNQQWRFNFGAGGKMMIQNIASGMCLDIPSVSHATGVRLQQYRCHGGPNQLFGVSAASYGDGFQLATHSGACVDVTAEGQVVQGACHFLDESKSWRVESRPERGHRSVSFGGRCLDVPFSSTSSGTAVQLYPCKHHGENQEWDFIASSGTYLTIRARHSRHCLTAVGSRLEQRTCRSTTDQQWSFANFGGVLYPILVPRSQPSSCLRSNSSGALDLGACSVFSGLYGADITALIEWR